MDERSAGRPDQNRKFGMLWIYPTNSGTLPLHNCYHQGLPWSLTVASPFSEQGEEDDADKVLEEVHHNGSN